MSKVTSKLQVTLPKRIADSYGIRPGDDIEFVPAGDDIRILTRRAPAQESYSLAERLRLFDEATARQRSRDERQAPTGGPAAGRGWTRDELYTRGPPG